MKRSRIHWRTTASIAMCLGASSLATACGAVNGPGQDSASDDSASIGASAEADSGGSETEASQAVGGPHIPGYAVGDFPPVPLFTLPDLSMLDTSLAGFSIKVDKAVGKYPGLTVSPARCDSSGKLTSGLSAVQLYGDGSGNLTGPDGQVNNYGDGSGNYSLNGTRVNVYGDGSGNYRKGAVLINSYGDGSGNYTNGTTIINLYGDGSGNYTDGKSVINDYGDGSGNYNDGKGVVINNYGDGSGNYTDGKIVINNYGDGSGNFTDGTTTVQYDADGTGDAGGPMKPIAKVPPLGDFPTMGSIKPIKSCGTTITLRDDVLFDFDKSDLRPGANAVLDSVTKALNDLKVSQAEVGGHTDSVGSDSYNQELSDRRANTVSSALTQRKVQTRLEATGYGEARPVAPNTLKGKDNPAGRQLNRRVEIYIPATGFSK